MSSLGIPNLGVPTERLAVLEASVEQLQRSFEAVSPTVSAKAHADRGCTKDELAALEHQLYQSLSRQHRELKECQSDLRRQLASLARGVSTKIEQIKCSLNQKADVSAVLAREGPAADTSDTRADVRKTTDAPTVPTMEQFQALEHLVSEKADLANVPTKAQFEAGNQMVLQSILSQKGHVNAMIQSMEQKLAAINGRITLKSDARALHTAQHIHELFEALSQKADSHDVATKADMQSFKTSLSQEWSEAAAKTEARFDALQESVETLSREFHSGATDIGQAHVRVRQDVASDLEPIKEQITALSQELCRKADCVQVSTKEELMDVSSKVLAAAATNFKAQFVQLEQLVGTKADAHAFPTADQLEALRTQVCQQVEKNEASIRNEMKKIWDRLALTSVKTEFLTSSVIGGLKSQMEALDKVLHSSISVDLQELHKRVERVGAALDKKADCDAVPSLEQLESLRVCVCQRSNTKAKPNLVDAEADAEAREFKRLKLRRVGRSAATPEATGAEGDIVASA